MTITRRRMVNNKNEAIVLRIQVRRGPMRIITRRMRRTRGTTKNTSKKNNKKNNKKATKKTNKKRNIRKNKTQK